MLPEKFLRGKPRKFGVYVSSLPEPEAGEGVRLSGPGRIHCPLGF